MVSTIPKKKKKKVTENKTRVAKCGFYRLSKLFILLLKKNYDVEKSYWRVII